MPETNIVFLHPDLGVGGAERLVVDAALSLKEKGHKVSFVTSHHDPGHCFEETKDGTFPVTVVGDWLPRNIFGRFFALCASIRMIYCAFYIIFNLSPDIVFCDILSVCIPILHLKVGRVIFYCHFPDQLLSKEEGWLKQLYRAPLNWIEEVTTGSADKIFVNSRFTRSVFKKTFTSIRKTPDILYPSIHTDNFDSVKVTNVNFLEPPLQADDIVFLSINRYERKKYVELALNAMSKMKLNIPKEVWQKVKLIIIGGYDNRVIENKEYFIELNNVAKQLEIQEHVYFLKSPSNHEKISLLRRCDCLVYTPPNEHFGIVPLEAMYSKKPVVAANSGGPTETVVHEKTGFLCENDAAAFADSMAPLTVDADLRKKMGTAGYRRFLDQFSFQAFSSELNNVVNRMINERS